jgi:hypothetical protein
LYYSNSEILELDKAGIYANGRLQRKSNEVLYPLKLLGGFFKDYQEVMWEGDITVSFT